MLIEKDRAEILSGVRGGYTMGSPITIRIENRDWKNWSEIMGAEHSNGERQVTCPRPGHADLTGRYEVCSYRFEKCTRACKRA